MRSLSLFCLLAAAAIAPAADPAAPQIRWPKVVRPAPPAPATAPVDELTPERWFVIDSDVELLLFASPNDKLDKAVETGPFKVRGKFADGGDAVETRTYKGKFVYFIEAKKGAAGPVELIVGPSGATKESDFERRLLRVGKDSTPPKPDVKPDPVTPAEPAPIPEKGFRVLIVYETADLAKLPASQAAALTSSEVRNYLNSACVVGADGKTKEWRILDKDANLSNESQLWQAAMKRDRKSLPWIVISDGTTGFEGPLPQNTADVLSLLKKRGG